eukprot:Amastigsp_a177466_9.p4 type:complete len:191 gc:universal Amastigsp_a177466_9:676-104(-)
MSAAQSSSRKPRGSPLSRNSESRRSRDENTSPMRRMTGVQEPDSEQRAHSDRIESKESACSRDAVALSTAARSTTPPAEKSVSSCRSSNAVFICRSASHERTSFGDDTKTPGDPGDATASDAEAPAPASCPARRCSSRSGAHTCANGSRCDARSTATRSASVGERRSAVGHDAQKVLLQFVRPQPRVIWP